MKKHVFFVLLLTSVFTFTAYAHPGQTNHSSGSTASSGVSSSASSESNYTVSYGDENEAMCEGYRNGLFDAYYQYDYSKADSELRLQTIEVLSEYFNSDEYGDPEEFDPEILEQSYQDAYNWGICDYITAEKAIECSQEFMQESIYQQGYEDGAANERDIIMNDPDFMRLDDPSKISDSESDTSSSIFNFIGIVSIIIASSFLIFVLQQLTTRLSETHPSAISSSLSSIFTFILVITFLPMAIASLSSVFRRWADERGKRYEAEDEALLRYHYEKYREGTYSPEIWEMEEFQKRGWHRY